MKLHLACGLRILKGYINIDIQNFKGVDLIADVARLPFQKNLIDLIYSCCVLEHLGKNQNMDFFRHTSWEDVLQHWYDLLKPGGVLYLSTVDFKAVCEEYLTNGNLERLIGITIGGQKNEEDLHGMLFDFELLQAGLEKAGFRSVQRYDWRQSDMFITNPLFDDFSRSYLPHMDFENGRLMMLNVTARK